MNERSERTVTPTSPRGPAARSEDRGSRRGGNVASLAPPRWLRDLLESDLGPRSRALAAAAVAVVGLVTALVVVPARGPLILLATALAVVIAVRWNRPQDLAWLAGALLPIQVIDGISLAGLEAIHIGVVGVVVLRFRPHLAGTAARLVTMFGAGALALAAAQLGFGLARDPFLPTVRFAAITVAALAVGVLLAARIGAHRAVLLGYLSGTAASATVALLQSVGAEWIRTGFFGPNRHPGMAFQAPGLSWHIVVALLVGIAALTTTRSAAARWATGAQMLVCTAAFLVCGAQGGFAGLGFAGLVCALPWRREIGRVVRTHRVVALSALVALLLALVVAGALGSASVRGLIGDPDKGFTNEVARLDSIGNGTEQLLDHPLAGTGFDDYDARYDVRPHFLPLNAAVTTGLLGFAIGAALVGLLVVVIVRGPSERTPSAMLGLAVLSAVFVQTLLTPSGSFASVERISMLLISVVLVRGASVPFPFDHRAAVPVDRPRREPGPMSAPSQRAPRHPDARAAVGRVGAGGEPPRRRSAGCPCRERAQPTRGTR